jgi:hypothetical protein
MIKQALSVYQYVAPLILTPLALYLWWQRYDGNLSLVLTACLIPILYAYIVPGIGTNVLQVWEFNSKLRLGRFRPHHGFVFGSATALMAWLCHSGPAQNLLDVLQTGFVFAAVLGFCNIVYDIQAIKSGILRVYNQPWADGQSTAAIVMDYAPWFFAGFGAVYGSGLATAEWLSAKGLMNPVVSGGFIPVLLVLAIALPVWGYRRHSFTTHGHSGCRPVHRD